MAALENIDYQKYIQLPDGTVIGIHRLTLLTTSDTISVLDLMDPSNSARSAAQLRRLGDTNVTVTTTGANTITIAGTAGTQCLIVSWHSKHTSMPTGQLP
jgi:hypothetical protein